MVDDESESWWGSSDEGHQRLTTPASIVASHQELRNPLHDLPVKAEVIVSNIDCVLLTHLHLDHIDDAAYKLLNKQVHIFVQDEQDRNTVMSHGFTHVEIIGEDSRFGDIHLAKSVPMPTISHFHEPRSRKLSTTAMIL